MTIVDCLAMLLTQAMVPAPPPFVPSDPRIRTVPYSENQVVSLPVSPGYAAVVSLNPDERVESIVVGDSASWQVTASKRGDHVVVKPLDRAGTTNMIVITGERRYVFLLEPDMGGGAPFVLRFDYPAQAPAPAEEAPPKASFRFRGARELYPETMTDDGVRTRIRWRPDRVLPAIFAVDRGGEERLINGRVVEGTYVVEDVAERFVFRSGRARATATRRPVEAKR